MIFLDTIHRGIVSFRSAAAIMLCLAATVSWGQRYLLKDGSAGLNDLSVTALAQDQTGYLWVGTENGLYRYDGFQYRQFGFADGLQEQSIRKLAVGLGGTLWLETSAGIYFQRSNNTFAEIHLPAPTNQFSLPPSETTFTSLSADRVLVATHGIVYLMRKTAPDKWTAETMHLEGKNIGGMLHASDGALWYGCDFDLCRQADGKTAHIGASLRLPQEQWQQILQASNGHLWLRGDHHLAEVIPSEHRAQLRDLPTPDAVQTIAEDRQGRIFAAQGAAFGVLDGHHWQMVTTDNGLTRAKIATLFVDRDDLLWIGMEGHGLKCWLGAGTWEAYTTSEGLSSDSVLATLRDRHGRLWIGTEAGLDDLPAGATTTQQWHGLKIPVTRITALAEAADGAIWAGSGNGGVVRIDPQTLSAKAWRIPQVYRIQAGSNHRVWIATARGLYLAQPPNATPLLVQDAVVDQPRKRFTDLAMDSAQDGSSRLWAATDQGILRLDRNGWRRIDPGLSGITPERIVIDRQENLWATGAFAGLMRLRVAGDRIYEAEHVAQPPLLSEKIVSLLVDRRGWLWMGQDAGLTSFDGRTWRNFTQDSGLLWNDCSRYALNEDRDGSLWIGTSGGLAHLIDPQSAIAATHGALILSQATLGATPLSNGSQVAWSKTPFIFSVASLHFKDTQPRRIRYRLLGLDSEWQESSEPTARYPQLQPGEYRLQVATIDANGTITEPAAEIAFRILPLWWQKRLVLFGLSGLLIVVPGILWCGWTLVAKHQGEPKNAVQRHTEGLDWERSAIARPRVQLRHLAECDELTGLWNPRIILERLHAEIDRARRNQLELSVVLIDLDHFGQLNNRHGRLTGDRVLKELSRILLRAVRSYDWVGRYGGGQFLMILPCSNADTACARAEQIRLSIQNMRFSNGDKAISVTASFGVTSGMPSDYEQMIGTAFTALYRAKEQGRNCVALLKLDHQEKMNQP